jgi:hypothetical protein
MLPRSLAARGALLAIVTAVVLGIRQNQIRLQDLTLDRMEAAAKAYLPPFASEYVDGARKAADAMWSGDSPRAAESGTCGWVTEKKLALASSRVVTPAGVIAAVGKSPA